MKQVTAVLIGAGLRGAHVYASYALEHPEEFRVVAVAEPDEEKRCAFAKRHGIPGTLAFASYEELLNREKMADCAMICTQDRMHFEPVTMALKAGYHVLCEKPMSTDPGEILKMGELSEQYGRILSVCHVLRYSPFFVKIREILDSGKLGRLICIQAIEEVGYWHHAHSFVRGNWRREDLSSPMILQKCCHDMDILAWLVGSPCRKISSFGNLTYFRKENRPERAPDRCMDGCSEREHCPFYAPRFYLEHEKAVEDGLVYAVTEKTSSDSVLEALKTGPYGRCVFACDNNVVDHQVVNLEFENQVQVSFVMCAFTDRCARELRIMGTAGELTGNMEDGEITVTDFCSGEKNRVVLRTPKTGHSGSDMAMMRDFVKQAASDGIMTGKSSAAVSVESHLMALAAEASRKSGQTVDFEEYKMALKKQKEKES